MAEQVKIMAVSAHPADFCSRAGGTLAKYVKEGARVKVVWLTHGETNESGFLVKSRPGISLEEVRRIREKEAFACAEVIGAEGRMFGFGDNPLRMTPERVDMLAQEIADFAPDTVFTHWKDELTYPTHWQTSESTVRAARLANLAEAKWDIRFFEPNLGSAARVGFVPDYYVDITTEFDQKIEALHKLEAQPELPGWYTVCNRWRAVEVGVVSGTEYAEGFVRYVPAPPVYKRLT